MTINKFMLAALKALSYQDLQIKKNYKLDRVVRDVTRIPLKQLYEIWDYVIQSDMDGYRIPVRIFEPKEQKKEDILLFFHGGGWVVGNINNYTTSCANLANATGRRVVSVDYRLAPEYPFPYAVEDCYRIAKELFLNRQLLGIHESQIVLIGDSAGGNIAAAVSLMAKDRGQFEIKKQILIYPSTYNDHNSETSPFDSIRENGTDYLLTAKRVCDYTDLYIQDQEDFNHPYFAPLLSDRLYEQPETLIISAEYDPLRDEGEAYGKKLMQYQNTVKIYRMKDALHGFFTLPPRFVHVRTCMKLVNDFLG